MRRLLFYSKNDETTGRCSEGSEYAKLPVIYLFFMHVYEEFANRDSWATSILHACI
jgi:hypothetical protein